METSRPMRLILVEDDPPLAHLLLDVMAEAGIEVAPVPSAADALELARSGPWDVCLLGEADPWSRSAPPPEAFAPLAARVPVVVTTVHVWGRKVDRQFKLPVRTRGAARRGPVGTECRRL